MCKDAGEVSPAQVAALFASIRAEVAAGPVPPEQASAEGPVERLAARDEAERLLALSAWAVSAERGVVRGPGIKGAVAYPVKRLLRPLLRWYVEPALIEQSQFDATVLKLIDELTERTGREATQAEQGDQNGT